MLRVLRGPSYQIAQQRVDARASEQRLGRKPSREASGALAGDGLALRAALVRDAKVDVGQMGRRRKIGEPFELALVGGARALAHDERGRGEQARDAEALEGLRRRIALFVQVEET